MEKKFFTLAELAQLTQSTLYGDPQKVITNVADLESATSEDASFLSNPLFETAPLRVYEKAMLKSQAGVIFISPKLMQKDGRNFLVIDNPSKAFQMVVEAFIGKPVNELIRDISGFNDIHASAVIHPKAIIGHNVIIGPLVVIDQYAKIGDHSFIGAGCYIGSESTVGKHCYLHPHVTIRERCTIGNRVILQPGVVIGSCGFGYAPDAEGRHVKINQLGSVILQDDVEIGANTTIDRSRYKETVISEGTKIDNLVQIGHGASIGRHNVIAAQSGIAGSAKTGERVVLGGQSAIAGHIKVGRDIMIGGKAGVSKSITKPGKYSGTPATPLDDYQRNQIHLRNIKIYIEQIKDLKKRIDVLEKNLSS